jgi:16S rRNA (cytidine1402-2'-O)-methyltransferase
VAGGSRPGPGRAGAGPGRDEPGPGRAGAGTLYLVPTPIGDPADITMRAVTVLRAAGILAAEDTRHAQTLLRSLGITGARLLSYHDHNEEARSRQLLAALRDGLDVALISDAGTPLVNDPGFRIVTAAIADGIRVCPLPGASAPVTALIGSGLPVASFYYGGFLPRRPAARQSALTKLRQLDATLIFFEAPHRLLATLTDLHAVLGDRMAALACNLTKPDERFARGRLTALSAELAALEAVRGQYTIVVDGAGAATGDEDAQALAGRLAGALLRHGVDSRTVRAAVMDVTGLPRNWVYEQVRARTEDGISAGRGHGRG